MGTFRHRNSGPDPKNGGAKPPAPVEEGVVITDLTLQPIALDGGAFAILGGKEAAFPSPRTTVRIPEEFLRFLSGSSSGSTAVKTMHLRIGDCDYNCRAYVMKKPENAVLAEPVLVVHLQRISYPHHAIRRVASEYHLTDREQEALRGISMGLTSKELAERMNISPNTVKTFLRTMMIKMGVTTRTGMLSKLLEYNGPNDMET